MNKIINIKTKKSIDDIAEFKDNDFAPCDIKFTNVHLKKLNKILTIELFSKNDLYVNSATLHDVMQPEGKSESHNHHNLAPEAIFGALNNLLNPECVVKVKKERYAVITTSISSLHEPLMLVIELNSGLIVNKKANVNKIVTIYPKSNLEKYLEKFKEKEILYKKMSINTGSNCLN